MPPKKFVSIQTQKRLLRDVADIMKNNLASQGIYYIHDEENILKGYAMIFGPKDTPYENGVYFFDFNFPSNYPYSPPKLTYLTNNGTTRFNPNLYRNGKVCFVFFTKCNWPNYLKSIILIHQYISNYRLMFS